MGHVYSKRSAPGVWVWLARLGNSNTAIVKHGQCVRVNELKFPGGAAAPPAPMLGTTLKLHAPVKLAGGVPIACDLNNLLLNQSPCFRHIDFPLLPSSLAYLYCIGIAYLR